MEQTDTSKNPLQGFSPAQIFVFGIVAGVLVLCTIGFFVMLGIVLGGDDAKGSGSAPTRVAADSYPTEAANPGAAAAGSVANMPPVTDDDHIRGPKNAKVTIVEYSDFECPFCSRFFPTTKQILEDYPNDVRLVYRHFPLSFHAEAVPAAEAAECAGDQGKFWEYHDKLFENQAGMGDALYSQIAKDLRLNTSKFEECRTSGKYTQKINDQQAGGAAAGVQGTPHTIVIGGDGQAQVVSGAQPYSVLQAAVNQYLN